jgi:Mor family transcriptional regulator
MQYQNASDILPHRLLRAVQAYAGGKLLYIPADEGLKCEWGGRNGAKQRYSVRNAEIRARRSDGETIDNLASLYGLSEDSIRKIVRSR